MIQRKKERVRTCHRKDQGFILGVYFWPVMTPRLCSHNAMMRILFYYVKSCKALSSCLLNFSKECSHSKYSINSTLVI